MPLLNQLTYKPFGPRAILVEWPARIDEEILKDIIRYKERIMDHKKDDLEDCIAGYHSLTLLYQNRVADFSAEQEALTSIYPEDTPDQEAAATLWKIPVCYDVAFGIDLEAMSEILKLSKEEIIQRHSQAMYTVYFIGFLPGFLYLGGLDDRLAIPRKALPRLDVAKGSVAIGGSQTGVYPMGSAGGWNILGKTPVSFFDVKNENPCFARAGDNIQFVPINVDEFNKLEADIEHGAYQAVSYPSND